MPASLFQAKIRGIRSYSPHPDKQQTIDFMPLTVVVGANGSGKTTIIEALKFIISGDEPPLSDCRRNFINTQQPSLGCDPHASVELSFQTARDVMCSARREIHETSKGKTVTPSIHSSYKLEGSMVQNIHKQDDWNKTIPKLFNIPNQALLNNVILCHQEDNLWCMAESGVVKQIFDKIFGCEQYKKEIKYMDTEMKNCRTDILLGEKDLALARQNLERKQALLDKSMRIKVELDKAANDIGTLGERISDAQLAKKQLVKEFEAFEMTIRKKTSFEEKISEFADQIETMRKLLRKQPLDPSLVSDEQLSKLITDHTLLVEETKKKQTALKQKEIELNSELRRLDSKKESIQEAMTKLKVVEMKSKESHLSLVKMCDDIGKDYSLPGLDSSKISESLKILECHERGLIEKKSLESEKEDDLSKKYQNISRDAMNLQSKCADLTHNIKGKENFVKQLSNQLADSNPIAKDLTDVEENLHRMDVVVSQMPKSQQADTLQSLVHDTSGVVQNLVRRVKTEGIAKIKSDIEKYTDDITKLRSQLSSFDLQRTELSKELNEVEAQQLATRTVAKDAHNKSIMFQNLHSNIKNLHDKYLGELRIVESNDSSEKFKELQSINALIEEKRTDLKDVSSGTYELSDKINISYEGHLELKKNADLRLLISKKQAIENKLDDMSEILADANRLDLVRSQIKELENSEQNLRDKRSTIVGAESSINKELSIVKLELRDHAKTNSKYSEKLGQLVCNQMILSDLEKLKDCFQTSITSFHNQMIIKINEALKIRWRQIYQGPDIDHIELVDEEITKGKDKKTFNYFIAMRKNGLRMKMRDKGSAGQKALASIILRMTLAELFVKDFALIALDEPTANLDQANVEALAGVIAKHVKRRSHRGANIQWIIITHDEKFLKCLDSECSPYFYRVALDHLGCSMITKISYQDAKVSQGSTDTSTTTSSI